MGLFGRLAGKKLLPGTNIGDDDDPDADPDASRAENPLENQRERQHHQQQRQKQQTPTSSDHHEQQQHQQHHQQQQQQQQPQGADFAPGVFHKKGKQKLQMGHKPLTANIRQPPSPPPVVVVHPQPPPLYSNVPAGTSSTTLWIANSDAAAVASSDLPSRIKPAGSPHGNSSSNNNNNNNNNNTGPQHKQKHKNQQGFFDHDEAVLRGPSPAAGDDDDEFFDDYVEEGEAATAISGDNKTRTSDDPSCMFLPERKITIRFDEYDEMQTCLHINDYTKHEIGKAWYRREDYDKMVDLARKTASKAVKREQELREELESMLGREKAKISATATSTTAAAGGGGGEKENNNHQKRNINNNNNNNNNNRSQKSSAKQKQKKKKPIEYRGLEAWTPDGALKVRSLKESSIENVWNEQSRQWEEGTFDPFAIMQVYLPVSRTAAASARERGANDEDIVKKIVQQEEMRAEKKRNRTVYRKSKAALKKTAKTTATGLVNGTGKIAVKTGKVGMKLGNRAVKAGVATATLDPRMMKEALKIRGNKKRECERKNIITQSRASHEKEVEEELSMCNSSEGKHSLTTQDDHSKIGNGIGNPTIHDDLSSATGSVDYGYEDPSANGGDFSLVSSKGSHSNSHSHSHSHSHSESAASTMGSSQLLSSPGRKKKSRLKLLGGPELKLLGVVPIPGTKKVYKDERREHKAEKRVIKMSRRPSWETGVSKGKY